MQARPAPAGDFWADTVHYCEPYLDVIQAPGGTPATQARVTAG